MFVQDYFEQQKDMCGFFSFCYGEAQFIASENILRDEFRTVSDKSYVCGPYPCLLLSEDISLSFESGNDVRELKQGSIIYLGDNGFDVIEANFLGENIFIVEIDLPKKAAVQRLNKRLRDISF